MSTERSSKAAPSILVYSPVSGEAREYAGLIQSQRPSLQLTVADSPDQFRLHIASAEIVMGWMFPPDAFRHAPHLRWIHKVSAGVEDVVYDQRPPEGVTLTRSHGALIAPRMVEYVLACIYAHTQRFAMAERQQRAHEWKRYRNDLAGGKTVGIAGLGDIGIAVAEGLRRNGLRVIGWRRTPVSVPGMERVYVGAAELEPFVGACDFVVVLVPLTSETTHLFNERVFAAMKSDAYLINIARGKVLDEAALIRALCEKRIAGAALDVFEQEPLPADSALWDLPEVRLTPHVSGPVIPADVVGFFVENLERYLAGEGLERRIDRGRGY